MAREKDIRFLLDRLKKKGTLTKLQIKKLSNFVMAALNQTIPDHLSECSKGRIQKILKITKNTLNHWIRKGAPRKLKNNREVFDPADIFKWRIQYQKRLDTDETVEKLAQEIREEDLKFKQERRLAIEIGRKIKTRELLPINEVKSFFRRIAHIIKSNIEPLVDDVQAYQEAIITSQNEFNEFIFESGTGDPEDDMLFDQKPIRNKYICKGTKADGTPCEYKAKKNGYCMQHYNKIKRRQ